MALSTSAVSVSDAREDTSAGATPAEDLSLVAALVVGTACVIVLVICLPVGICAMIHFLRKRAPPKVNPMGFLNVVPKMVDSEMQTSDHGSDDEEDGGGGVLSGVFGSRTSLPGVAGVRSPASLAPQRSRVMPPSVLTSSPRGEVAVTL